MEALQTHHSEPEIPEMMLENDVEALLEDETTL